ncbi:molybdopterin dinucleotide binding domain-containing protein, partial [Rhizobium ruizarguesonis]
IAPGLEEDPRLADADTLVLPTLRSHDQYNTTIYSLDARYRGVFGRRDVIFMTSGDLSARGLADGDKVDIASVAETNSRAVRGFTAVAY